jgi:hypothetical protein
MDFKNVDPNSGNVAERNSKFMQFFTSLIEMECTKAFLVGMDLCNMAQFSFTFYKNIWRSFLWCLHCTQTEKNSSYHHNSYKKGLNLAFFSFTESPFNSILTIKFPTYHKISKKSYHIFISQQHAQNSNGQNLATDGL